MPHQAPAATEDGKGGVKESIKSAAKDAAEAVKVAATADHGDDPEGHDEL